MKYLHGWWGYFLCMDEAKHYVENVVDIPEEAKQDEVRAVDVDALFGGEEISLEGMPELRDIRKLMPADQLDLYADLASFAEALPKEEDGSAEDAEGVRAAAKVIRGVQDAVLSLAVDPEEFSAWLVEQENPSATLMKVFNEVFSSLGNL